MDLYLCKTRCQREIEAADRQIAPLVYELYGLRWRRSLSWSDVDGISRLERVPSKFFS